MAMIAVPILILGSLYILSEEQKRKKKMEEQNNVLSEKTQFLKGSTKETFVNNNLPKVDNLPGNIITNMNTYNNSNQHTDKYFRNDLIIESNDINVDNKINLLTGEQVDVDKFKHNNMKPFFGSKIKGGTTDYNNNESLLDNKQGFGSQLFSKNEQAPLFKPEDNYKYQYGTPNNTDFFQSRMNESNKMNNVTLWEPQRVGPGLNLSYGQQNEQGFNTGGTEGFGGFNAGMTARESWMPKNVDELRVDSNPKNVYDLNGHQGPANSSIKYAGPNDRVGVIEKHLPEKFFKSGPERWFTTTGSEKNPPIRSDYVLPLENRVNTTTEYYGVGSHANTGQATYVNQNFEEAKKQNLGQLPFSNATATGQNFASPNDFGIKGFNILPNNRVTDKDGDYMGAVYGAAKAVVAPLLDILNPTRKENVIGNLRESGNVNGAARSGHIFNNNDKVRTTNREMVSDKIGMNYLNVQRQNNDGYMTNQHIPINNQRDTTNIYYTGTSSQQGTGLRPYNNAYAQHNNVNKTYESRPNQGNMSLFNNYTNMDINRDESLFENNRSNVMNGGPSIIPSAQFMGEVNGMQQYDVDYYGNRLDPQLLDGFKKNPYTHSLHSVA